MPRYEELSPQQIESKNVPVRDVRTERCEVPSQDFSPFLSFAGIEIPRGDIRQLRLDVRTSACADVLISTCCWCPAVRNYLERRSNLKTSPAGTFGPSGARSLLRTSVLFYLSQGLKSQEGTSAYCWCPAVRDYLHSRSNLKTSPAGTFGPSGARSLPRTSVLFYLSQGLKSRERTSACCWRPAVRNYFHSRSNLKTSPAGTFGPSGARSLLRTSVLFYLSQELKSR